MIDFYDLARSGTAPEASKSKSSQVAASAFAARPKTRSVDNDVQDFNIDLRTNKPSYPQHIYEEDGDYYSRADLGHNEELLQAIESFQADLEDWSGRKDYDAPAPGNFAVKQPSTAAGRRPSRDGRKSAHSSAVSAYTQNVPQIVLQTSKKGSKTQASSPRTVREPKPDLRADIRAVYGADILDKAAPVQRPKSQKTNSQNTNTGITSHHKVSDEAIPLSPERGVAYGSYDQQEVSYDQEEPRESTSATGARRSSSASRLRSNISANAQAQGQASSQGQSASAAAAGAATKPFSVRKAASTAATSQRQATVPRPFSHSEVRPTSQNVTTRPPTVDSSAAAGGSAVTSSAGKKLAPKKAPTSGVNPLLKSSLAPSNRGKSEVASRSSDIDSDGTGESLHVPPRASEYQEYQEFHSDRYERVPTAGPSTGPSAGPSAMETFVKERASTANAKAPSSRRPQGDGGDGSNGAMYSYTHSAGNVGTTGLGSTAKRSDPREATTSSGGNAASSHVSAGKGSSSREPVGRSISRSPTMDPLGMNKPDSDIALVDFIQDSDIMESSFDESPILAAYLQQKSNAVHKTTQNYETGESRKDGAGRPQSRKLYLGADKEGDDSSSPSVVKSYKTAPRSAGARYAAPDSPALQMQGASDAHREHVGLRKMSSFSELVSPTRKWNDAGSQLPDLRPPSRQSSAFPVHLADEPPSTASSAVRHTEMMGSTLMSKSSKVTSPTSKTTPMPPKKASSMQWNRNDNVEDEVDEPYDEEVPYKHSDGEVESIPTSEADSPRGRKSSQGVTSAQAVFGSSMTSVLTSMSAGSVNTATSLLAATAASAAAAAAASTVHPTREHIGIVRAPVIPEEVNPIDYPTYELQRPPSRQKFAAPQHLFEGPPPPTRAGTEKETTRSKGSSAVSDFRSGGQGSSPEQNTDGVPSSRSNTARATTHSYNPRDDGFADLEYGDEPFVIQFNSSSSPEKSSYAEQYDQYGMQAQNRVHRRSYNSLTGGNGTINPGHSRSSSSASNNWDHDADGVLSPLSTHRPQTVAHAGVGKTTRMLGVIPSSGAGVTPSPVQPLRGKSAGEGLKSPGSIPLRREGNNFLVMSQQPHAPSQQAPTSALLGRGSGYGKVGEYTAGPPASGRMHNSAWTDGEVSSRNPRAQNVKMVESAHPYDAGYSVTPSASSHALLLQHPAAMRSTSRSPSSDACESDDDDMTILTEDSGKHNMDAGMSMHSLALDSSLGEDFLSLFAPGP